MAAAVDKDFSLALEMTRLAVEMTRLRWNVVPRGGSDGEILPAVKEDFSLRSK